MYPRVPTPDMNMLIVGWSLLHRLTRLGCACRSELQPTYFCFVVIIAGGVIVQLLEGTRGGPQRSLVIKCIPVSLREK
jgi:hypothetical protein